MASPTRRHAVSSQVPVKNVLEPARSESRAHLHERVADTLADNGGATYCVAGFRTRAEYQRRGDEAGVPLGKVRFTNCTGGGAYSQPVDGRVQIHLECDVEVEA